MRILVASMKSKMPELSTLSDSHFCYDSAVELCFLGQCYANRNV